MKRLIVLSTVLFLAASTFGIYQFICHANNPSIQHLYSNSNDVGIENVILDTSNKTQLHDPELRSVSKKKQESTLHENSLPETNGEKNKHHTRKRKKVTIDDVDLKSFSRAAPVKIEPSVEASAVEANEHPSTEE